MITVQAFLNAVEENAARVTHYESGGDGSGDGGCDCIGLIIGALRLAGVKWTGTHGTNWAARNAIREAWPYRIESVSELTPGDLVFKARREGESGYALPDAYKNSLNLTDYYHVGVIMRTDPLLILHCTDVEGGIKRDTTLGNWEYYGQLKAVSFSGGDGEEILYFARVVSDNGYPVRLRPEPNTDRKEICKVPVNMIVRVLDDSLKDWDKVEYTGIVGYMMKKFLQPLNEPQEPDETPPGQDSAVTVDRNALNSAYEAVKSAEETLKKLLEG